jgi:hypothetical protein
MKARFVEVGWLTPSARLRGQIPKNRTFGERSVEPKTITAETNNL